VEWKKYECYDFEALCGFEYGALDWQWPFNLHLRHYVGSFNLIQFEKKHKEALNSHERVMYKDTIISTYLIQWVF
jgi:hypothetical protein